MQFPGDGREDPSIRTCVLVQALLIGRLLGECAFQGVEALVRSPARGALHVGTSLSDDPLGYFTWWML
jgi:hypothetical protein